ncbi:DNA polymerase III subunit [Caldicellulosiruptor naganoensis]|uniref:DNA polymerase III subunit n=1 Tax=Caldicellulosiruptor naganoensis TaxID=29324 RepID=A0ABY7BF89_9FIRM|nr:DNA polymerase III subunit [Caldicellulosiruptor naganoensis]WAM31274.1 DNA polymerase III subunit [Caldicellulosiruptor naganoensis]
MNLDTFVGQKEIVFTLKKALKNPFHAYIFEGEKGLGKKLLARIFSKHILCESKSSCRICKSCHLFEASSHPDFNIIRRQEDKKEISVESIREIIKDLSRGPVFSDKKIFIIEEGEELSISAQNALLKTLEEPPPYALFIITCNNIERLLPTVLSRSIVLSFKRYSASEIAKILEQNNLEPKDYILKLCKGNPKIALDFYNKEVQNKRDYIFDKILSYDGASFNLIKEFESDFEKFKNDFEFLFENVIYFLRDALLYKKTKSIELITNTDKLEKIIEFSNKHTITHIYKLLQDFMILDKYPDANVISDNVLDMIFLKLSGG